MASVPRAADRPPPSLCDTLTTLLNAAGISKSSTIRLTGSAGLAAMLWFCRHGFEQVGYSRVGPCPSDDCDLVFVPQTCDLEALGRILDLGPHPRAGGVLIVQTPEENRGGRIDPVHSLLQRRGYDIERCLAGRHRELHVARRRTWSSDLRAA